MSQPTGQDRQAEASQINPSKSEVLSNKMERESERGEMNGANVRGAMIGKGDVPAVLSSKDLPGGSGSSKPERPGIRRPGGYHDKEPKAVSSNRNGRQ